MQRNKSKRHHNACTTDIVGENRRAQLVACTKNESISESKPMTTMVIITTVQGTIQEIKNTHAKTLVAGLKRLNGLNPTRCK